MGQTHIRLLLYTFCYGYEQANQQIDRQTYLYSAYKFKRVTKRLTNVTHMA